MRLADIFKNLIEVRGISEELVVEAIHESFTQAYQDIFGAQQVEVIIDLSQDIFKVFLPKVIVDKVKDPRYELTKNQAKDALESKGYPFDEEMSEVKIPHYPNEDFSPTEIMRISDQILYKLREYEKNSLRYEFVKKKGELVSGSVVKIDQEGNIFVDIHKAIAKLPVREQSPLEHYEPGDNLRAVVHSVQNIERDGRSKSRHFEIILSRRSPSLVRELMHIEVPDIAEKNIEIKNIVRSVGYKTKVVVDTNQSNIDPVALCIGPHGIRITAVIKEIGGEKIDIIRYVPDSKEFVKLALTPAKVERIVITDEENRQMYAIVSQDQIPYAFGRQKQNLILASKLSNYKIQIITDTEIDDYDLQDVGVQDLGGMFGTTLSTLSLTSDIMDKLHELEIFSVEQLAEVHVNNQYERLSLLDEKEISFIKECIENTLNINDAEENDEGTSLQMLPGLSSELIQLLHDNNISNIEDLVVLYQEEKLSEIISLTEEQILMIKETIAENIEIEE